MLYRGRARWAMGAKAEFKSGCTPNRRMAYRFSGCCARCSGKDDLEEKMMGRYISGSRLKRRSTHEIVPRTDFRQRPVCSTSSIRMTALLIMELRSKDELTPLAILYAGR